MIHQAKFIEKTVISNYSLLYRVEGTSSNKSVYMLSGHLDVAPTPKRTFWDYEPFSGDIAIEHRCSYCDTAFDVCEADTKKYVHGRGAIDTKNVVFGILEALENVLKNNSRPTRTFYIAFSHDEEIGGLDGSVQIKNEMKKVLKKYQEILDFILDEGTVVIKDYFSFIKDPLIYISVAEIGWNKVKVEMNPFTNDSVMNDLSMKKERCNNSWTLVGALRKLRDAQQPFRYGDGPESDTWSYLSLHMNHFVYKLLASNMWLFKGLISSGLVDASQVYINTSE
jgi:carboxypeptidase PM20D1